MGVSPARKGRRDAQAILTVATRKEVAPEKVLAEMEAALRSGTAARSVTVARVRDGLFVTTLGSAHQGMGSLRAIGTRAHDAARRVAGEAWVCVAKVEGGPGPSERAAQDARHAAEVARVLFPPRAPFFAEDVLLQVGIFSDRRLQGSLLSLLQPIDQQGAQKAQLLLGSLQTFFDSDMSVSKAARALGIHRHTLEYRLRTAETLIGRSVRRSPDRVSVELALFARRLTGSAQR